jgi:hypothetical protein
MRLEDPCRVHCKGRPISYKDGNESRSLRVFTGSVDFGLLDEQTPRVLMVSVPRLQDERGVHIYIQC